MSINPSPKNTVQVPCTYEGCDLVFSSVREMKKHKLLYPHHDYCRKCDEDFEDEERLLIHKLSPDNDHICCPICGMDFKSEGGRDLHCQQAHRADHHIVCQGCQSVFKSPSALMRHIEDNDCPEISNSRLIREQSKKLIIKETLNAGQGESLPVLADPKDFDDIDGGVRVLSFEREKRNREALANQPKPELGQMDPTADVESFLALKHWPKLDEEPEKRSPSDLMGFTPDSKKSLSRGQENVRIIVPDRGSFGAGGLLDAGQTLRMIDQNWDTTRFFNSFSGDYICPGCNKVFRVMKDFEEHILNKSRTRGGIQCPGCFRSFKSTSALIAHCESATARCQVSTGHKYAQIIDELTGGVIQARYNDDDTVRYEAGSLDAPKTTTVGPRMHKTIW